MAQYKTAPDPNEKSWPAGIPYIVGNEGCERFSYYGMNAILYIYAVSLYVAQQVPAEQAGDLATASVHFFKTGVYAFPMIGAILADRLLGKYNTILWLSIVYCMGHLVLSMTEGSSTGLHIGLLLIAVGSGGIKPCVSANVGDQFGKSNWHLINKIYQIFYFVINFGSFFAVWLIPLFQVWFGWSVAFAIPGVLMCIATFIFWLGRHRFVHVPAKPGGRLGALDTLCSVLLFMTFGSLFFTADLSGRTQLAVSLACLVSGLAVFQKRQSIQQDDGFMAISYFWVRERLRGTIMRLIYTPAANGTASFNGSVNYSRSIHDNFSAEAIEGVKAMFRIISIFVLVSIFWSLFDQHASSWIRQAEMMNLHFELPWYGGLNVLPSQVPSLNPVLVMILIPFMTYFVFPVFTKIGIGLTPLRKMSAGMAIASLAFVVVALLQIQIEGVAAAGQKLHVAWQLIPYTLITLAEVLVSVTGLEFAYTQAPQRMKSTVMGFWLLSVAFGNILVALTSEFGHLALTDFFWLFAGLMAVAAALFALRAAFYIPRDYAQ